MSNLDILRKTSPLIICITNDVVKNYTANGLVALGASPAMSEYPEDLDDLLKYASGLLINIGTLTDVTWDLFKKALDIAEKYKVPTVLDPVAVGASKFRKKVVMDLVENHKISVIRGNAGEIASLIDIKVETKGVDSYEVSNVEKIALEANKKLNIPIVLTGKIDAVAVDREVITLENGSNLMPKVIGTGCLLGAVVASFINLNSQDKLIKKLEECISVYNIAGEIAEKRIKENLPGTYQIEFLNALHLISNDDVIKNKKVNYYV